MNGLMASLVIAVNITLSTPTASKWETDYGKALRAAQSTHRPLVVVLENPRDPVQSVGEEALTSSYGRPELLARFELCRVDVTTKTGKLVAEAFGAKQFPYTAVSDQSCKKIVQRHVGRPSPRKWIAMLASRIRPGQFRSPILQDNAVFSAENCFT